MSVKQLNPVYYANVYNTTSAANDYPLRPVAVPGWGDELYVVATSSVMKIPLPFLTQSDLLIL
jgi:hypothetical protein